MGIFNPEFFYNQRIRELRRTFSKADPFPHLVLSDLFRREFLLGVVAEFAQIDAAEWLVRKDGRQFKFGTRSNPALPPLAQTYFDAVNSGPFVRFLTGLSGAEGLITDCCLTNGGMHEIPTGGRFALHIDNQRHPITGLNTRLTLITYLNADWRPENGGALELRNFHAPAQGRSILPILGQTVVFLNTPTSLHGHPDPVAGPKTLRRRSLATYYYTNGLPQGESPDDSYSTTYVATEPPSAGERLRRIAKGLLPPLAGEFYRATSKALVRRAYKRG